jgi:hypothetical protein
MKTRRLIFVVAALASVFAAVPAPAGAARGMEVALQDDLLFLHRGAFAGPYYSRDKAFDQMRDMQGSALRVNIIWAHAVANDQDRLEEKPDKVRYDWAPYESLVKLARGYGVEVQLSLSGPAPAWGTPTKRVETGYWRPNAQYFKEFSRAVAKRFKGKVRRYSIWNEPNWDKWLGPQREAPWRYRQLYQVASKAIWSVNKRAKVWFGELVPYDSPHSIAPLEFTRRVACVDNRYRPTAQWKRERKAGPLSGKRCAGGTLKADGFAHHPYEFNKRPSKARRPGRDDVGMGSLDRLTSALDKLEETRTLVPRTGPWLPFYLTEFGYFRAGARTIAEKKRAKWSVEGFKIAQRHPRVKQLLYYVFVRPPGGIVFDLSLLDHDGRETGTYKALVQWGAGAAARHEIATPGPKKPGVNDSNPPPPPGGPPPPPGETPAPEEPACPIPLPGVPCPVPSSSPPPLG